MAGLKDVKAGFEGNPGDKDDLHHEMKHAEARPDPKLNVIMKDISVSRTLSGGTVSRTVPETEQVRKTDPGVSRSLQRKTEEEKRVQLKRSEVCAETVTKTVKTAFSADKPETVRIPGSMGLYTYDDRDIGTRLREVAEMKTREVHPGVSRTDGRTAKTSAGTYSQSHEDRVALAASRLHAPSKKKKE